jgi:hypothetical protein
MAQAAHDRTAEASDRVIYTAKTHTTGGRENGVSRSSDGRLDLKLSLPGSPRIGTNPEQLFAAGWSACFEGAIGVVAHKKKIKLPMRWRSMPRSICIWTAMVGTSSALGSISPFPTLTGASRRAWSMMQKGSVPIRRRQKATSPSPTIWSEQDLSRWPLQFNPKYAM